LLNEFLGLALLNASLLTHGLRRPLRRLANDWRAIDSARTVHERRIGRLHIE
jgi:hypothetical protein